MNMITLDAELKEKLKDITALAELCDVDGRTLGYFVPAELYTRLVYAWAKAEFSDDKERAQARLEIQSGKVMTTKEAIAHLEKLA